MMMKAFGSFALVLALATACSPVPPPLNRTKDEEAVRESVFRYQFQYGAPSTPQHPAALFLFIGKPGADPSDEFMSRFAGMNPPVKKGSKAKNDNPSGVIDPETGKPGIIFSTAVVEWISPKFASVSGGYFVSGGNSSGSDYILELREGKWVVVKDSKLWTDKKL